VQPDRGTVVFLVDRRPRLRANYQIIGRLTGAEQSWRWAWADPEVDAAGSADARVVREHGERHGIPELTAPVLKTADLDPAELTSLGLVLADGAAQWIWPSGPGIFDFVVLHAITEIPPVVA
jgi:hypothetical protein